MARIFTPRTVDYRKRAFHIRTINMEMCTGCIRVASVSIFHFYVFCWRIPNFDVTLFAQSGWIYVIG